MTADLVDAGLGGHIFPLFLHLLDQFAFVDTIDDEIVDKGRLGTKDMTVTGSTGGFLSGLTLDFRSLAATQIFVDVVLLTTLTSLGTGALLAE